MRVNFWRGMSKICCSMFVFCKRRENRIPLDIWDYTKEQLYDELQALDYQTQKLAKVLRRKFGE